MWEGWALSALCWSRDQTWPYQRCSSVTLTQTSFLGGPKLSQPGWRTLEWLPNTEGHPSQAEIFWQPMGACPQSTHTSRPALPEMSPCLQSGRGGQPGHQHLWKMKEVEADPCAEAKRLQPGPRQGWEGELAGERRGEGKGTCPKRWGIVLRGREGNSKQLCDGRGRSLVGGGEVTQDWERPVLHWQGKERKVS